MTPGGFSERAVGTVESAVEAARDYTARLTPRSRSRRPDDGRDYDWLDPKALYRCHEQTVRLTFDPER